MMLMCVMGTLKMDEGDGLRGCRAHCVWGWDGDKNDW